MITENGIHSIGVIKTSFIEKKNMKIPIIIYTIIQKAINCFKYLLLNESEELRTKVMDDLDPDVIHISWYQSIYIKKYQWDCMAVAIYYGNVEIIKILEESGIEKGENPAHIEAAILSYRNQIAKAIINQMKEKNEQYDHEFLIRGLLASTINNNIKGAEIIFNSGIDVNIESHVSLPLPKHGKKTLLHYAVENNSKDIVKILLSKGADMIGFDSIV